MDKGEEKRKKWINKEWEWEELENEKDGEMKKEKIIIKERWKCKKRKVMKICGERKKYMMYV